MNTLFEDAEISLAKCFMEQVNNKKYILQPTELKSNKTQRMYNSFIDYVKESKPQTYYQSDFIQLSEKDVIDIFANTILTLLGSNNQIIEEIKEFLSILTVSNDNEILSGIKLTIENRKTGEKQETIEVPSISNTSSIVSLVHEFIHFHISKNNINLNKKYYYEEIFSIYAEKVATYYVEKLLNQQENLEKKIENTRLDGIVWHYKGRLEEIRDLQKLYNNGKRNNSLNPEMIREIERTCPWINNSKLREAYFNYRDNLAYSYGFGYLYGESLFKRFVEDEEKTTYDINKVLRGESQIEKLFSDYNIGINQPTITTAKQKVKKVTQ